MRHDYERPNIAAVAASLIVIGIVWGIGLLFVTAVVAGIVRFIAWTVTGA